VFSPNEGEARSIVGAPPEAPRDPGRAEAEALAVAGQLLELGAKTVLLRRGERGVLLADARSGEAVWVGVPRDPAPAPRAGAWAGLFACRQAVTEHAGRRLDRPGTRPARLG
jgi:sugar/nucleoside kinase (ribokinase family)